MCGGVDLGYILPVLVGVYARFGVAGSRPAFEKNFSFLYCCYSFFTFSFIFFDKPKDRWMEP
jgi:hypothetical protein